MPEELPKNPEEAIEPESVGPFVDYYKALGIDRNIKPGAMKKRYEEMRNSGQLDEVAMKAYNVLKDKQSRREYNTQYDEQKKSELKNEVATEGLPEKPADFNESAERTEAGDAKPEASEKPVEEKLTRKEILDKSNKKEHEVYDATEGGDY